MKTKVIYLLFMTVVFTLQTYSQENYANENKTCGSTASIQTTLPSTGTVKALVIYFKFRDDYFDVFPYTNDWDEDFLHNNALPSWAYDVLSPTVQSQYANPSLSGYFHNMSLGNFELIGDEYPNDGAPYISRNDVNWYYAPHSDTEQNCIPNPTRHLSYAVYEALTNLDEQINYNDYDSDHDGYVDLIIMWFRFHQAGCTSFGSFSGISDLTAGNPNNYFVPGVTEITTQDGAKIRGSSGVVVEGVSSRGVNLVAHEITHLMGFPHDQWQGYFSLMTWEGMGIANSYERLSLGWINSTTQFKTITSTQLNYLLRDFETYGEAIKIPINSNDYYILENRQRLSFYSSENWTKWAAGHGYTEGPPMIPDEGLIINKYTNNVENKFQIQCADQQWRYEKDQYYYSYPFIKMYPSTNNYGYVPLFEMDIYNGNQYDFNCVNIDGEDEVCINKIRKYHPDAWGDNNDLWDIGYNQVFSTWSNPKTALNNLAIEIKSVDPSTKNMYLDIRFENPENASPSKPLFLRVSKAFIPPNLNEFHPYLQWYRNLEPDVDNGVGKYRIYRGVVTNINIDPPYTLIAEIPSSSQTYTDDEITLYDPIPDNPECPFVKKSYVYRVTAVDFPQNLESVRSDSAYIAGFEYTCSLGGDNPPSVNNGSIPKDFAIYNYPNPFNPTTEIRYSLPINSFVTIKIYNLLGEEVALLVNHAYKSAGTYNVQFDGTNLASGLYLYRIEAGNYIETKKMLLIK